MRITVQDLGLTAWGQGGSRNFGFMMSAECMDTLGFGPSTLNLSLRVRKAGYLLGA